jgi:hypothetical protein
MFGSDSWVTERTVASLDLQAGDFYFLHSLQTGSGVYLAFLQLGAGDFSPA